MSNSVCVYDLQSTQAEEYMDVRKNSNEQCAFCVFVLKLNIFLSVCVFCNDVNLSTLYIHRKFSCSSAKKKPNAMCSIVIREDVCNVCCMESGDDARTQ